ncbi:TPA: S1 family peptidase [Salmonella enterica]|uniref:S1 family peptidase n=1 Tax=Salmonella enterica TaxID=28901 RepID=A0A761G929_SALER|nr:S1 family peptidase [Salmonella enterica]
MFKRTLIVNSALALTLFLVSPLALSAEPEPARPIVSQQAIASYAKDFNVSSSEAARRLALMEKSDLISNKIIKEFGEDSIAGVFFDNSEDFKFVIRTTRKGSKYRLITDFAKNEFNDLPIEVVPNSPRNFRAISNIIDNQSQRLAKKIPGFQSLAYNPSMDALELNIVEPDKTKKNRIISMYNLDKISGMPVIVNLLDGAILPVTLAGGGVLTTSDGIGGNCTAGWPAKNLAGEAGILTAYHCLENGIRKNFTYLGNDGKSTYKLIATVSPPFSQDLAFLKAPAGVNVDEPFFYKDFTSNASYVFDPLPQQSIKVANPPLSPAGTQLCHFGRNTGYSCGIVNSVQAKATRYSKNINGDMRQSCTKGDVCGPMITITSPSLKCGSGDSGGPVFFGSNKPVGIASACNLTEMAQGKPTLLYIAPIYNAHEISVTIASVPWAY